MDRTTLSTIVKVTIIAFGVLFTGAAVATLPVAAFEWQYLAILVFGILIAPRVSLPLPRSKFALNLSETLIFLTLLLYGGSAAVVVAAIETLGSCLYLRKRNFPFGPLMIPANVSYNAISTALTYLAWLGLQSSLPYKLDQAATPNLITVMGFLALTQSFISSFFAAMHQGLKDGTGLLATWKKYCFSITMTQIFGASLAMVVYKIVSFESVVAAATVFVALIVAYLNYRQSIAEINCAIELAEEAEREKAEAERVRRVEAEQHAEQLGISLRKEERANEALRKSEKDFQHAALHDSLTGLANRKLLGETLGRLIAQYKHDPSNNFQVLFLDIRRFKNINDTLGHSVGDKVLSIAAKRFLRTVNSGDMVARIGGDEFAIILCNLSTVAKAQKVARRIYQNITQPFSLGGRRISIDVNIGIASCDAEYNTPEEILRDADIAMHYAKEKSEGPAVFTRDLRERFLERVRFEMDLRHAVDRGELSLHYQPIVSLGDGRLVGFEALLRWHHSEFGMIPPNKFIPIAEQAGLIQPITVWILSDACKQLVNWQRISAEYKDLMVSVNISGKHLSNNDLIEDVENVLEVTGLPARCLKLEITETTAMENAENTINVLNRLKHIGVQLSIDDFGTGYSSLSYLQRLPFDTLKIDRSFVYNIGENGENSEIVQTIISLSKNLKMRVIAEGIETVAQLAVLTTLGCDFGQGYLMARPKGRDETEKLLYERPNLLPELRETDFGSAKGAVADENLPVF